MSEEVHGLVKPNEVFLYAINNTFLLYSQVSFHTFTQQASANIISLALFSHTPLTICNLH